MSRKLIAIFKTLGPILLILTVTGYLYKDLIYSFYQQEEWMALGNIMVKGKSYIFQNTPNPISLILGQGRLFSSFLVYFLIGKFPFNTVPQNLFSIFFHLINVVLVFLLAKYLTKKTFSSILATLFFGANAVSSGAVTWAAVGTLPATTLILISLFLFLKSLQSDQKSKGKWALGAFLVCYTSLFFKEIGMFLLLLYPVAFLIFSNSSLHKSIKPWQLIAFGTVTLVALWKILELQSSSSTNALFLTGKNMYFLPTLVVRSVLYPLTSFALMLIPPESFLNFARLLTNIYYPFFPESQFILIAQTVVLDLLAVTLSSAMFMLLLVFVKKFSSQERKTVIFLVIFTVSSFLPYIIISKSFSYLESRYYYVGVVGLSLLASSLLAKVEERFKKSFYFVSIGAILLIFSHSMVVKNDLSKLANISSERKIFLNQLSSLKPSLNSSKNIFLLNGSQDFYIPGNKVPFQQGVGYTLMVWYYNSGNIPKDLIKERAFFEIGSQGYKETGEKGFGYFSDAVALKEFLKERGKDQNITITGLYYDAAQKKLSSNENF